jgi:hypothetical protein
VGEREEGGELTSADERRRSGGTWLRRRRGGETRCAASAASAHGDDGGTPTAKGTQRAGARRGEAVVGEKLRKNRGQFGFGDVVGEKTAQESLGEDAQCALAL